MPLYEYACTACGQAFEITQKFSDPVLKDCPQCGKPALEKQISNTSFQLKGGGWYKTDYKKSDSSGTASKATPSSSTDSKPEGSGTGSGGTKASGGGCGGGACGSGGCA